jgi:hypothetical protein
MLLAPKPIPHTPSPSESRKGFTLGSASLVVGEDGGLHGLIGYEALPDWVAAGKEPDSALRDVDVTKVEYDDKRIITAGEMLDNAVKNTKVAAQHSSSIGGSTNGLSGGSGKEKTLDDWLAEGEAEEEEEDEEEEEEEDEDVEESEESEVSSEEVSESEESDDNEHDKLVK